MNALKAHFASAKQHTVQRMSPAQERAMMKEIKKQCADYHRKHEREIMGLLLWELHVQKGWGYKRCKDFYYDFTPKLEELLNRYEMSDDDRFWLCTQKLKDELGIDLEEWEKASEG